MNSESKPPRPTTRNPFKPSSMLARQFDAMLAAYASVHRDVIRENGTVRCMGNSLATAFWRGYDSTPPNIIQRDSLAWAAYRAGQAQRLIDSKRGAVVAPLPMYQGRAA